MNKTTLLYIISFLCITLQVHAQHADFRKLSPMVRMAAMEYQTAGPSKTEQKSRGMLNTPDRQERLCAFVRITSDADRILAEHHCKQLARFGNIYIADIPMSHLAGLSRHANVTRIEAGPSCTALNDTTALVLDVDKVNNGFELSQAFTGKDVVVGVEDIGFDMTHPTFLDANGGLRVKRLWDMISTDTLDSELFVGAEYTNEEDLLNYAHSRDSELTGHGTHTAGTAAGSGYQGKYRGMAFDSDLCLVANVTSNNSELVDSINESKFTTATDVLGFKYCFDYADSQGKPCVVNFSEGSHQDFYDQDMLFYETLDSLVGPGHILVAAAGNEGNTENYLCKPKGQARGGSFFNNSTKTIFLNMRADAPFDIRFTLYKSGQDPIALTIPTSRILEQPDSMLQDSIVVNGKSYLIFLAGYPTCFDKDLMAYEVYVRGAGSTIGISIPLSIEALGEEAKVEMFRYIGYFARSEKDPELDGGECRYSIYAPGSAPAAICVGSTSYRKGFVNYQGVFQGVDYGTDGVRGTYSGVGPTFDERIKPDVLAPGSNVISAFSSYYFEAQEKKYNVFTRKVVELFEHNGREYGWAMDSGTSMSCPVVTGIIALWLQANPQLTPEDVKGIFERTCRHLTDTVSYPNNYDGYGEINAYRGLLDILGLTGIKEISADHPDCVGMRLLSSSIILDFEDAATKDFTVRIYAPQGMLMHAVPFSAGDRRYEVDIQDLPHGVYAVQLESSERGVRGSWLVRK